MKSDPKFHRILLKLSGESLMGQNDFGLHHATVNRICSEIKQISDRKVEICLVVGGGNIFRGVSSKSRDLNRVTADYMGMLGTVINALALKNALDNIGATSHVLSAIPMSPICEPYTSENANKYLSTGSIVIFAAGTGNPLFTTDTAAALRAAEMKCDVILKGTLVDGIYDEDPKQNLKAKRYKVINHSEILKKDLSIMDTAAIALAKENHLPIIVFSIVEPNTLVKVLYGEGCFTKVTPN